MSSSSVENLDLSCRRYHRKELAKQYSKSFTTGRLNSAKVDSRNDSVREESEPLLPMGRGALSLSRSGPDDESSTNIRQRASKTFPAVDVTGGKRKGTSSNGERNADTFLQNDFLLLDIKKGDTLQSISLQYHSSVSDLKRANNLISNQEFYALRQLRIPVKKHGLLTEGLPLAKESRGYFAAAENGYSVRPVNVGIGPISRGGSRADAVAFFRKMDEDLVKIMQNTKSQKDSLEAATIALTSPSIQPLVEKAHIGADCGIQWCYLVVAAILLGLILPIIAVIYMYTQHHNETNLELHHNSGSGFQGLMSLGKRNES